MPNPVYPTPPIARTAAFLARLVQRLPIGTNLALAHLLFTLLAGHLLGSRGALFPALSAAGLDPQQTCRAVAALREGTWSIPPLLERLHHLITKEKQAPPVRIGTWQPLLLDWVGFFRPRLTDCTSKHFDSRAGKALPAIEIGMMARLLHVGKRTFPCLIALVRHGDTLALLQMARARQASEDVLVVDRQVKIGHLQAAGITCYEADLRFAYRYLIDHGIRGAFLVDGGSFERSFGFRPMPLEQGISATAASFLKS